MSRHCWADAYGPYGFKVRVFERTPGGALYARLPNSAYRGPGTAPRYREVALGHSDHERAKGWALAESEKLRAGIESAADPIPTAARVFTGYRGATTYLPEMRRNKKPGSVNNDVRYSELWTRFLGAQKDLSKITLDEWNRFIRLRGTGLIDTRGRPVPPEDAKAVRGWTLRADMEWLGWVCAWAVRNNVMARNPIAADQFVLPRGDKRRRPIATVDRYEKLQAVASVVHPYLPVLLALVHHTARRIRAVLALRYRDLVLTKTKQWPHGGIAWPSETDKMGEDWVAPLSAEARKALDGWISEHPGIGDAYLFPSPRDASTPITYEAASKLLVKAERRAKVIKQNGTLWHAYRRGWATARKGHAVQDVAAAGGWKNANTVALIYQQADAASMFAVVSAPTHDLREAAES
jgi:integrase